MLHAAVSARAVRFDERRTDLPDIERRLAAAISNLDAMAERVARLERELEIRRENESDPTIRAIIMIVADDFGVSFRDMLSMRQTTDIALPRHVAMYLCKEMTMFSYPSIGRSFGGRDHTTILHGFRKTSNRLMSDDVLAARIQRIRDKIKSECRK